jgi:hypothetical protein
LVVGQCRAWRESTWTTRHQYRRGCDRHAHLGERTAVGVGARMMTTNARGFVGVTARCSARGPIRSVPPSIAATSFIPSVGHASAVLGMQRVSFHAPCWGECEPIPAGK